MIQMMRLIIIDWTVIRVVHLIDMISVLYLTLLCLGISLNAAKLQIPKDFKLGVATAAYQIEGAWNTNGKGESIWDYFLHLSPEKIKDRSNGDIACDSYNKLDEDIAIIAELNVDFYRFSISWPRLLPNGFSNEVNKDGVRYYNEVINKVLEKGVEPVVTLYHWDLPLKVHELGGWTSPYIKDYFVEYAKVCFELFGDRVKTWITVNEPTIVCRHGYAEGGHAPFYNVSGIGNYLCAHNLLLAHADVYDLYKTKFRSKQGGKIGIALDATWFEPYTDTQDDKTAADLMMQFYFGWLAHPIFSKTGDYPKVMRDRVDELSKKQNFRRSRLPRFTKDELNKVKGSADFLGINHYTAVYAKMNGSCDVSIVSQSNDVCVDYLVDDSWESIARPLTKVVPWALRKLLNWIKDSYNNVEVLVVENGMSGLEDEGLEDFARARYLKKYLNATLRAALEDNCNVSGYTFWSLMDVFEWLDGYTIRFGLYHVDFKSPNLTRTAKRSASVYRDIIRSRILDDSHNFL